MHRHHNQWYSVLLPIPIHHIRAGYNSPLLQFLVRPFVGTVQDGVQMEEEKRSAPEDIRNDDTSSWPFCARF